MSSVAVVHGGGSFGCRDVAARDAARRSATAAVRGETSGVGVAAGGGPMDGGNDGGGPAGGGIDGGGPAGGGIDGAGPAGGGTDGGGPAGGGPKAVEAEGGTTAGALFLPNMLDIRARPLAASEPPVGAREAGGGGPGGGGPGGGGPGGGAPAGGP